MTPSSARAREIWRRQHRHHHDPPTRVSAVGTAENGAASVLTVPAPHAGAPAGYLPATKIPLRSTSRGSMKTVGVSEFGGPEALRVFEMPEPHAGPGQVRIRVHAATVNPGDRYLRNGALGRTSPAPPYVPGMEAAGVVDEIGSDTDTDLRLGDRVMAMADPTTPRAAPTRNMLPCPRNRWPARHRG